MLLFLHDVTYYGKYRDCRGVLHLAYRCESVNLLPLRCQEAYLILPPRGGERDLAGVKRPPRLALPLGKDWKLAGICLLQEWVMVLAMMSSILIMLVILCLLLSAPPNAQEQQMLFAAIGVVSLLWLIRGACHLWWCRSNYDQAQQLLRRLERHPMPAGLLAALRLEVDLVYGKITEAEARERSRRQLEM